MPAFNYFCFDFADEHISSGQLETRCRDAVMHFESLRAVFPTTPDDTLLYVILDKPDISISHHQILACGHDDDDDPYIQHLCREDSRQTFQMQTPLTKFFIMKRSAASPPRYSAIVRLSHAQYDEVSITILCQTLRSGNLPSNNRPFSQYAYFAHKTAPASHAYWSTLLGGSKMTHLPPYPEPYHSVVQIRQRFKFPVLNDTTPAVIFSVAWAMSLMKICGTRDVVFGHVVAGRKTMDLLGNVHAVFGACANKIPVRVRSGGGGKQMEDVLRDVQMQQSPPGEGEDMVSWKDIVREHCTDWPEETTFGSVIQYQNSGLDAVRGGGKEEGCRLVEMDVRPGPGLFVLCTPMGEGGSTKHMVELATRGVGVTYSAARKLMDMLEEVLRLLAVGGRVQEGLLWGVDGCVCRVDMFGIYTDEQ